MDALDLTDPTTAVDDSGAPAPDDTQVPFYVAGAMNHTLLNNDQTTSWDERVDNMGRFAISAMVSGVDSLANTAIAGVNFFRDDDDKFASLDTATQLASIDSNLSDYYVENKNAVDLGGFILTSLVPGIGGVKLLNAGQKVLRTAKATGLLGTNMARATGLLAPETDLYIANASREIAQSQATFSAINANTLKALGSSAYQNTLEAAAFETAVAVTMNKSPVLENQDVGDLTKNILYGAVLGGAIGTAFSAAGIFGTIRRAGKAADAAEKPYTYIHELPEGASASERIIQRYSDRENIPDVPQGTDFTQKFTRLSDNKVTALETRIRADFQTISSDSELANMVADRSINMTSTEAENAFFGVQEIGRLGKSIKTEREIKGINAGDNLDLPVADQIGNKKVAFIKLTGEDSGTTTFTSPAVFNLADQYTSQEAVLSKAKSYGFSMRKPWDAGAATDHMEAEARYIWARNFAKIKEGSTVSSTDIPLLEAAYEQAIPIKVKLSNGTLQETTTPDDIYEVLKQSKVEASNNLLYNPTVSLSTEEISKITNVRRSYLEGEQSVTESDDLFAKQYNDRTYTDMLIKNGRWNKDDGLVDTSLKPSYMKVGIDFQSIKSVDGNVLQGMAYIASKSKVLQSTMDNVFASQSGELNNRFYRPPEELLLKANRYGAGAGRVTFANGNYGSLESWTESTGAATADMIVAFKQSSRDILEPVLSKLAQNPKAALEFQAINEQIAGTAERYILNETGDALVPRALARYEEAISEGLTVKSPVLQEGAPLEIPITTPEAREAISAHIDVNGNRVTRLKEIRAAQGYSDEKDATTFYPIRPDPRDYNHFAIVVDPSITGVGHTKMIHATSSDDLRQLIEKVPSQFKVVTKSQSEEWHKALGDYDWDRTLHESYMDSSLKSSGVNSQFFPKTDPLKISQDILNSHLKYDTIHARELVNAKFSKEFAELERLGEQYTNISSSRYASRWAAIEKETKNPYLDYIKTSLNVSRIDEYPLLKGFNTVLDKAFSAAANTVGSLFAKTKSIDDFETVNKALKELGVSSAYHDSASEFIVNKRVNRGDAVNFIRKANSILSTLVLRLDPLNALNNAVGASVLLGSEARYVTSKIASGDTDAVGKLSQLMSIEVPGTKQAIRSPTKLIANSYKRYFDPVLGPKLKAVYKKNGWITDISKQMDTIFEDLTVGADETVETLNSRLGKAYKNTKDLIGDGITIGEKATGNKFAEEMNRFVAADVMNQLTELAVSKGLMTPAESTSYINTFVNRTQGNVRASQRPMMFQGPMGQAIGLFQTYQFNMMQQMFRYVAEGSKKDVATLLGLQSTIYGLNGLPAFNFINTHIVGTASGNPEHRDFYTSVYGIAGKTTGDWLLYGLPSNLIKTNLYTRGDINPRQVTIIPTNPVDIPIVNATASFFGNLQNTLTKVGNGGNVWQSILQGIEHQGLSRPLSGMAQVLQAYDNPSRLVYATSKAGNILGANDLFSVASISRLAGGKPLDDAIVNDATFRLSVYQAADEARKSAIASAVKSTAMLGSSPSTDETTNFLTEYVKAGGNQKDFNRWMLNQITNANTTQANKIIKNLRSPYAQNLQIIMSGSDWSISNATPIPTASSDTTVF